MEYRVVWPASQRPGEFETSEFMSCREAFALARKMNERESAMSATKPTVKKHERSHRFTVITWCEDQKQVMADWVEASTIESAKHAPIIQARLAYAIFIATVPGHVVVHSNKD
jgi:hypothetical protein